MGQEEFFISRAGTLSAKKAGISLHSAYDPIKEAQRFLDSRFTEIPGAVILIGSGLGYLDRQILQQYPHHKVLSLHLSSLFIDKADLRSYESDDYHLWVPEQGPLGRFLSAHMSEMDLEGLQVLIWPSSLQAYPEYENIINEVTAFVKQMQGSFFSLGHFGWRWLNNALHNFASWDNQAALPKVKNTLIAASGPSLNQVMPILRSHRDKFYLIALPSSLHTLQYHDIQPDLTVMTDGGYYARRHLEFLPSHLPVAMPLIAAQDANHPHFVFSFESYFEKRLLADINIPSLPWNGTVAANAIMLAVAMTEGKIILAGQDFCAQGVHLHAFPHSFAEIYQEQSQKLQPLLDFYQKSVWNSGHSLSVYAHWFQNYPWPGNIYRLFATDIALPFKEIGQEEIKALPVCSFSVPSGQKNIVMSKDERLMRISSLVKELRQQFQQECSDPQQRDLWLYLDALGLYQYYKAKRLKQDIAQTRAALCQKVSQRLEILARQWA